MEIRRNPGRVAFFTRSHEGRERRVVELTCDWSRWWSERFKTFTLCNIEVSQMRRPGDNRVCLTVEILGLGFFLAA